MRYTPSLVALSAAVYAVVARPTLSSSEPIYDEAPRFATIGQRMMEVPSGPILSERKHFKPEPEMELGELVYPMVKRKLPHSAIPRVPIPLGVSPKPIGYLGPPLPAPKQNPFSPPTAADIATTFTAEGLSSTLIPPTWDGTIVIYARGTGQAGNIGQTPGPQFMSALQWQLGPARVIFQGLAYPAVVPEFFAGGSPSGSHDMAALVESTAARFPKAKIVLSGYSQGAQVVHNAVWALATSNSPAIDRINAVALFGDPLNGKAVPPALTSRTRTYCNSNDEVCFGGYKQSIGHLTYDKFAVDAAVWVQRQVQHA